MQLLLLPCIRGQCETACLLTYCLAALHFQKDNPGRFSQLSSIGMQNEPCFSLTVEYTSEKEANLRKELSSEMKHSLNNFGTMSNSQINFMDESFPHGPYL